MILCVQVPDMLIIKGKNQEIHLQVKYCYLRYIL